MLRKVHVEVVGTDGLFSIWMSFELNSSEQAAWLITFIYATILHIQQLDPQLKRKQNNYEETKMNNPDCSNNISVC